MASFPPLPRVAHYGMHGYDIIAHQRALTKVGIRHKKNAGYFGPFFLANVRAFDTKHLPASQQNGMVDDATYVALRKMKAYDGFGDWLIRKYQQELNALRAKNSIVLKQQGVVHAAMYGVFKRDEMHYTQDSRRMNWLNPPRHIPLYPTYTDCSGFATWCYWEADAPDPNGFNYNGYGYTGTMIVNGRIVTSTDNLRLGDLCFYGSPVSHVAVYVGNGNVSSFGSEVGPLLLPVRYRADFNHCRTYFPG